MNFKHIPVYIYLLSNPVTAGESFRSMAAATSAAWLHPWTFTWPRAASRSCVLSLSEASSALPLKSALLVS